MICSSCGSNSPPGMRFCGHCGSALPGSVVGKTLQVGEATVQNSDIVMMVGADLKQRFLQAGLESAGQRRNVTVLFVDLCDYTGLSGRFDTESLYEIIQRYIRMLAEKVYQYEGMVDKLTGDGLMALFGAPIAHENPAELAVRAAVEMQVGLEQLNHEFQDRLEAKLQVHIGLNHGSVVVGGIGSDLLFDYTAIGDTVNLARRLQETALPDTILVSQSIYQSTQALFDYQVQPGLDLKGYQAGEVGFVLLGAKSQPGSVRGIQGLRSPLIGRQDELGIIRSALTEISNKKQGQFVALIGEAGIGKSRLTAEFKATINQDQFTVLEGQSLTYRKSVSYWIFLEIIRAFLGVNSNSGHDQVQEKLVEKLDLILGTRSREVLPFLENLLSLEVSDPLARQRIQYLDAEQVRQQTFIAIRDLLLAEAQRYPLILIFEDLHWADEISLDLLEFLLESIEDQPILVVAITRPSYENNFENLVDHATNRFKERANIIHLTNLSDEQSDELISGLLCMQNIPEEFKAQIMHRAAGIPFYIEEILRMLIDNQSLVLENGRWLLSLSADLNLDVPDNLQDLILTRFDRLNPIQRNLLQTASVIGREFNVSILKQVMGYGEEFDFGDVLAPLEEKAFIHPVQEASFGRYLFRHVLTSDAVYKTLLRRDRIRLHGTVANTLEMVYRDQLDNQVEVLAGHYLRSEFQEKALHYLILAGNKSAREYANMQAKRYFEDAKDLLPEVEHSPEQAAYVWIGLGDVLVFIGEYADARDCYQAAINLQLPDLKIQAELRPNVVQRKLAVTYERQGEFEQALYHLALAEESLKATGISTPVDQAQILNARGWIFFLRGNFQESKAVLESGLDLVDGTDAFSTLAALLNRLGAVSYQLRDYRQAVKYVSKSLEYRKMLGDLSGEARLYNNLGLLGLMSGELSDAKNNFKRSVDLLEKVGDTEGIALANINLGLVKFDLGDFESAEEHLDRAKIVADKIGHRFYFGLACMYLGRLETAIGNHQKAADSLEEGLEIFAELGAEDNQIDCVCYIAENYLDWGNLAEATEWSQRANIALTKNGEKLMNSVQSGRVLRVQGAVARNAGDLDQAKKFLEESQEIFSVASEKLESARTSYELGLLAEERADFRGAQEYFNQARLIFTDVGAKKELQRVEARLALVTL